MVLFWVWAALPPAEASCYRYEVHLDHNGPDRKHQHQARHYSHYTGVVLPLDIYSHDVTKRHVRSVVYFSQSYLRKTLRFNHNPHTESQKETADVIKYTVKIMRQS